MNLLYENYHSERNRQKLVINDNNFTYGVILSFLQKIKIKSKKILDIGCGVGTIDFYLAKKGATVLGVDISQNGISIAKENASILGFKNKIKYKVLDFQKQSIQGKYDLVICSEVLEHIKDDKQAVKKINRLLKKGAIVIASSPSINAPLFRLGLLKKFDKEVGHLRRYTIRSFIKLFTDAEFKVMETKKTEGILRNFLFTNSFGGFLLRILNKWPFSEIVTFFDNLTIPIFGESDIYLVAQKK